MLHETESEGETARNEGGKDWEEKEVAFGGKSGFLLISNAIF